MSDKKQEKKETLLEFFDVKTEVNLNSSNVDLDLTDGKYNYTAIELINELDKQDCKVFDCDIVALLRPRGFTEDEWEKALERAKDNVGKGYDTLFDLIDNTEMSCVELVRDALIGSFDNFEDYKKRFFHFESMIEANNGELIPEMFFKCRDFHVELYIDRRDN